MRHVHPSAAYRSYADLARAQRHGVDYDIHVEHRPQSPVAIIAPHGGRIEGGTSEAARQIAGLEHSYYLFEGQRPGRDNFEHLHLTSRFFDEPRCLALVTASDIVMAVHGYATDGPDVLIGGLDVQLKGRLQTALSEHGLTCLADGHPYPGTTPSNICNRGRRGRGIQLELSARLRRSRDFTALALAVRSVLADRPGETPYEETNQ